MNWRKLICWFRGHRMYRIESGHPIAALIPTEQCSRCGYWEAKPKSVLLGIDRTEWTWWRNK